MAQSSGKGTCKANQRQSKAHKGGYTKYRNEMRREKSRLRKLRKHIARHARDKAALAAIKVFEKTLKGYV